MSRLQIGCHKVKMLDNWNF